MIRVFVRHEGAMAGNYPRNVTGSLKVLGPEPGPFPVEWDFIKWVLPIADANPQGQVRAFHPDFEPRFLARTQGPSI